MASTTRRGRRVRRWLSMMTAIALLVAMTGPGFTALAYGLESEAPADQQVQAPADPPKPEPPKEEVQPPVDPAPADPAPTDPAPADPAPTDPAPADLGGTDGGTGDGAPADEPPPPSNDPDPATVPAQPATDSPTPVLMASSAMTVATVAEAPNSATGDGMSPTSMRLDPPGGDAFGSDTFRIQDTSSDVVSGTRTFVHNGFNVTITYTVYQGAYGPAFDFTSTAPVLAVFVKGGANGGGNMYHYHADSRFTGGNSEDTALHSPPNSGSWGGLSHIDVEFADVQPPSEKVTVKKFNDLDGDGVKDADDPWLQGWSFTLSKTGWSRTEQTDSQGVATFDAVPGAGAYTLTESLTAPDDKVWVCTTSNATQSLTLAAGDQKTAGKVGNRHVIVKTFSVPNPTAGASYHVHFTVEDRTHHGETGHHDDTYTLDLAPVPGGGVAAIQELYPDENGLVHIKSIDWHAVRDGLSYTILSQSGSGCSHTEDISDDKVNDPGYTSIVSGHKYNDLDRDGDTERHLTGGGTSEPGIANWLITLYRADGTVYDTTKTASDGSWHFDDVLPGSYYVGEDNPGGWTAKAKPVHVDRDNTFTVGDGTTKTGLDFFNCETTGDLKVIKFNDLDGDGAKDAAETVAPAGTWTFIRTGDSTLRTAGLDGSYTWSGVSAGSYTVTETPVPSGWTCTTGIAGRTATVVSGQTATVYVGNHETVDNEISGHKFDHEGGAGLDGWTIELWEKDGSAALDTTVTANGGHWAFYDLEPGDYYVKEVIKSGWLQMHRPAYYDSATAYGLDHDTHLQNLNFENEDRTVDNEISGHKFADVDNDHQRETGEPGLDGWTIELWEKDGSAAVDTTVTANGGHWAFYDVAPGDYYVKEVIPPGSDWEMTLGPDDGGSSAKAFGLEHDTTKSGLDFWNFKPGTLRIFKFKDFNGDGVMNGDDTGWARDFTLVGPGGPRHVSTPLDGTLSITDLVPGDYTLDEDADPDSYESTDLLTEEFTLELGGSFETTIGNTPYAHVDIFKFNDRDGDGTWDEEPYEEGLVRSFTLVGPQGPSSETSTAATNGSGALTFGRLKPGTYTLTESALSGWFSGSSLVTTFTLTGGESFEIDVPNTQYATVDVFKFNDLDGDGVNDEEPGLARSFTLVGPEGSDTETRTASTTSSGNLSFTGLKPGWYTLDEAPEAGWYESSGLLPVRFQLAGGGSRSFEIGNTQYGDLNGIKFNDRLNGNGVRETGEPTLTGWRIVLYKLREQGPTDLLRSVSLTSIEITPTPPSPGYEWVAGTLTGANGSYSFGNLRPGTYFLAEEVQAGWIRTVSPLEPITVTSGTSIHDLDFGNWMPFIPYSPPDLGIRKSVTPTVVDPGQTVVYTLTYFNIGKGSATNFVIVDDYDETKMDVVDASGGTVSGGMITWHIAGPLAPGASGTISYRMRVKDDVAGGTVIDNKATISIGDVFDPTMDDNSDVARITVDEPFLPFTGADVTMLLLAAAALAVAGALIRRSAYRKAA
jgi:uncharacterized repeat protein (TIGR01451 family)